MPQTIEVPDLADDTVRLLDERAHALGLDRATYLRQIIERHLNPAHAERTFAEILAPIHEATLASGMTEEEIERIILEEIEAARRERPEGSRDAA